MCVFEAERWIRRTFASRIRGHVPYDYINLFRCQGFWSREPEGFIGPKRRFSTRHEPGVSLEVCYG